jgi:hypothetical protein
VKQFKISFCTLWATSEYGHLLQQLMVRVGKLWHNGVSARIANCNIALAPGDEGAPLLSDLAIQS